MHKFVHHEAMEVEEKLAEEGSDILREPVTTSSHLLDEERLSR